MSLNFSTALSRVIHGSNTTLDNLPNTTATYWAWVYRTSNGASQTIFGKTNAYPAGSTFLVDNAGGEGELRFISFRGAASTDWTDFVSATGRVALNTWTFVAATVAEAGSPRVVLYSGTLAATVAAETGLTLSQDGTGTYQSDAAYEQWVGNIELATTNRFLGLIQRGGIVNRVLALGELRAIQYATVAQANVSGTVLLFDYHGATTQPDLSGHPLNYGEVTTATAATPAPLRGYAA